MLDVRRNHDAVTGVHDPGLCPDRECELPEQDYCDLLLGVVVHRSDRIGLEGDEVRHHRIGGHGAKFEARDDD